MEKKDLDTWTEELGNLNPSLGLAVISHGMLGQPASLGPSAFLPVKWEQLDLPSLLHKML